MTSFPNPGSVGADELLAKLQRGSLWPRVPTVEQIGTIRTLCWHTQDPPYDFGYGLDALRLYWRDGRKLSVAPSGRIYS